MKILFKDGEKMVELTEENLKNVVSETSGFFRTKPSSVKEFLENTSKRGNVTYNETTIGHFYSEYSSMEYTEKKS